MPGPWAAGWQLRSRQPPRGLRSAAPHRGGVARGFVPPRQPALDSPLPPRGRDASHWATPERSEACSPGSGGPRPRLREERASPSVGTDVSGFMQIRNCPLAPRAPTLWWEPSMGSSWLEGSTSLKESHTKSQNEFFFLEFSYHFSALSSSPHKGKKPQK